VTRALVNGLPLPSLLVDLLAAHRWCHPGDAILQTVVPWIKDPLVFLPSLKEMAIASQWELFIEDPDFAAFIHYARGAQSVTPMELPWLDVEQAIFILSSQWPGDDQGVALDYRTSRTDPRVLASDWETTHACLWREVTPTFSAFVQQLGL